MPIAEKIYTAQQIHVPPELPDILKQFTKAAIRTQPPDLIQWSACYFRALANGEQPPVKQRLEFPAIRMTGLTPELLIVLRKEFGQTPDGLVGKEELEAKWASLQLEPQRIQELFQVGGFESDTINWTEFYCLAAGTVGGNLLETMKVISETLAEDGAPGVPFEKFAEMYTYLVRMDGNVPDNQRDTVLQFLKQRSDANGGMVSADDFASNPDCPKLY